MNDTDLDLLVRRTIACRDDILKILLATSEKLGPDEIANGLAVELVGSHLAHLTPERIRETIRCAENMADAMPRVQ